MAEAISRPAVRPTALPAADWGRRTALPAADWGRRTALPAADWGRRTGLGCGLVGLLVAVGSVSWWALKGKHWAPITGTVVGGTLAIGCCVRGRIGLGRQADPAAPRTVADGTPAAAQVITHQRTIMALPLKQRLEASIRLGGEVAPQLLEEAGGDAHKAAALMADTLAVYFQTHPPKHESAAWFGTQTCVQIVALSVRNRGLSAEETSAAMLQAWSDIVCGTPTSISIGGNRRCAELTLPVRAEATRFVFVEVIAGRLPADARVLNCLRVATAPLSSTHWEYVTGPVGGTPLDPARVQALRKQISDAWN